MTARVGEWMGACLWRPHRGHCETWWALSLHGQPCNCPSLPAAWSGSPGCPGAPWAAASAFVPMFASSGAARVSLSPLWGGRAGCEHLEKGEAGFLLIHRPRKAERSWGKLFLTLTTISVPGLGLLVTNLDVNSSGSLMHRLIHILPQSFLVRWQVTCHARTYFWLFWQAGSPLCFSQMHRGCWNRSWLISCCLAPSPAQETL